MAIKVSKYIKRMQDKRNGILPSKVLAEATTNDVSDESSQEEEKEIFEDFIDNHPQLYLGHFGTDSFIYVASSDQMILHLIENFKKVFEKNDLKTIRNAPESKYKNLIGIPLQTYKNNFNSEEILKAPVDTLEEYVNMNDDGKIYPLRFTIDDSSNFVSYNVITAVYYFHNDIQSVKDYLNFFPVEKQIEMLKNTVERFEKDISIKSYNSIDSLSQNIAEKFLPLFKSMYLELDLGHQIPEATAHKPALKF